MAACGGAPVRLRLPHPEVGGAGSGSEAHPAYTEPDHHGLQLRLRPDNGANALRGTTGDAGSLRRAASGFLRCGRSLVCGHRYRHFGAGRGLAAGPGLRGPALASRNVAPGRISTGCPSATRKSAGARRRHRYCAGWCVLGGGFRCGGGRSRGAGLLRGRGLRRRHGWHRNAYCRSGCRRKKRNVRRRREGYRRQGRRKCQRVIRGSRGHGRRQRSPDCGKKR